MATPTDPFESPKELIAGVRDDLNELETRSTAFFKEHPYTEIKEADPQSGEHIHKVRFDVRPPPKLRRICTHIVSDLRHALDQAVWASCKELGVKGTKTYFPFASDPDDLATLFTKKYRCANVAPEIQPFLTALEPYPRGQGYQGGDDFLRWLGTIAGPNKHQVTLAVATGTEAPNVRHFRAEKTRGLFNWDTAKREFTVGTFPIGTKYDYDLDLPVHITFRNAPEELDGVPIATALTHLTSKVDSIVIGLEAKTAQVLANRPP